MSQNTDILCLFDLFKGYFYSFVLPLFYVIVFLYDSYYVTLVARNMSL